MTDKYPVTPKSCCCYLLNVLWIRLVLATAPSPSWSSHHSLAPGFCSHLLGDFPACTLATVRPQLRSDQVSLKSESVFCGFSWPLGWVPSTSPWSDSLTSLGSLPRHQASLPFLLPLRVLWYPVPRGLSSHCVQVLNRGTLKNLGTLYLTFKMTKHSACLL